MLKNLFAKPLELKIGDNKLLINSTDDFAFIMDGRTALSTGKLSELFVQSIDQLEDQVKKIANVKESLYKIITHAVEKPESINRSIRELEPTIFSQDHNWRDIIKALNEGDDEFNSLRNIALAKYLKYLSSLEETIGHICQEKKQSDQASSVGDENQEFGATWAPNKFISEPEIDLSSEEKFKRLPKNKVVKIQLPTGGYLDLRLASYECKLVANDGVVQFINNTGKTTLNKGRHIIGRSSKSTVKIDTTQKYVSRAHLQVIVRDEYRLELTDLSSVGTYISNDIFNIN